MPVHTVCCVPGCFDKDNPRHRFPDANRNRILARKWLKAVGNRQLLKLTPKQLRSARVCRLHFREKDSAHTRLVLNTVPKLKLPDPIVIGNSALTELSSATLKRRFICSDHFDQKYILKSKLANTAVPLKYPRDVAEQNIRPSNAIDSGEYYEPFSPNETSSSEDEGHSNDRDVDTIISDIQNKYFQRKTQSINQENEIIIKQEDDETFESSVSQIPKKYFLHKTQSINQENDERSEFSVSQTPNKSKTINFNSSDENIVVVDSSAITRTIDLCSSPKIPRTYLGTSDKTSKKSFAPESKTSTTSVSSVKTRKMFIKRSRAISNEILPSKTSTTNLVQSLTTFENLPIETPTTEEVKQTNVKINCPVCRNNKNEKLFNSITNIVSSVTEDKNVNDVFSEFVANYLNQLSEEEARKKRFLIKKLLTS